MARKSCAWRSSVHHLGNYCGHFIACGPYGRGEGCMQILFAQFDGRGWLGRRSRIYIAVGLKEIVCPEFMWLGSQASKGLQPT